MSLGACGLTLHLLPSAVPTWFVHTFVDGLSTRWLWAHFMGMVLDGIGLWLIAIMTLHRSRVYARIARRRAASLAHEYCAGVEELQSVEI